MALFLQSAKEITQFTNFIKLCNLQDIYNHILLIKNVNFFTIYKNIF